MTVIINILKESWFVFGRMSPYLLFGFLMAGVLSVIISPKFVETHLGKRGLKQVIKASALGVPLPLCSCSVIPVAASLRSHGASKGATISFLASTPQTGVDSVMVTWSLLGPVFALYRVITAFITGIVGGQIVDRVEGDEALPEKKSEESCPHCGDKHGKLSHIFRYGFVTLPRDIGGALLIGILLSGILSAIIPDNYFAGRIGSGFLSMIVMMLIGIPIYVCSTGSVPIAFALIKMGLSPGAALVFLITGPATNVATVTTVWKTMGKRVAIIYLMSIAVCALVVGVLLNFLFVSIDIKGTLPTYHMMYGLFYHISAVILLIILILSIISGKVRKSKK